MFCTKCGNELSQGAVFCGRCGAQTAGDTVSKIDLHTKHSQSLQPNRASTQQQHPKRAGVGHRRNGKSKLVAISAVVTVLVGIVIFALSSSDFFDISLPTRAQILADAQVALANDDFIMSRGLIVDEYISISGLPTDDDAQLTGSYINALEVRLGVTAQTEQAIFELEYTFNYFLGADGWQVSRLDLVSSTARPLDTIAQGEIDNLVSQLQNELGGYEITLAGRTTDLAGNFDELLFTANLQHLMALEVREVFLPLQFDTHQGEWISLYHSISEPIFQDWNILGSYIVTYNNNNNIDYTLTLNITNMTDTLIYASGRVVSISHGGRHEYTRYFDMTFPFSLRASSIIDFEIDGFVTRFAGWGTIVAEAWTSNTVSFRSDGAHLRGRVWGAGGHAIWGYSQRELNRLD